MQAFDIFKSGNKSDSDESPDSGVKRQSIFGPQKTPKNRGFKSRDINVSHSSKFTKIFKSTNMRYF